MASALRFAIVLALAVGVATAAPTEPERSVVDSSGNLRVPESYRENYQSLGTWSIANDQGTGASKCTPSLHHRVR
jgi:hypothetical protein